MINKALGSIYVKETAGFGEKNLKHYLHVKHLSEKVPYQVIKQIQFRNDNYNNITNSNCNQPNSLHNGFHGRSRLKEDTQTQKINDQITLKSLILRYLL